MVEAGGIEPPSEDSPTMATTRLVHDLEVTPASPTDRLRRSQPIEDSDDEPTMRVLPSRESVAPKVIG